MVEYLSKARASQVLSLLLKNRSIEPFMKKIILFLLLCISVSLQAQKLQLAIGHAAPLG